MIGRPKGPDALVRLHRRLVIDATTGCLVFQGTGKANRYGRIKVDGRSVYAHRIAWEEVHGEIPSGLDVLHKCDNPPCCNPDHLFLGTQADNMRDRDEKGRHVTFRGHGHSGSKLTEEDVRCMRAAYSAGERAASIARRYTHKVSPSRVDQILWGRAWAHVIDV